MQLNQNKNFICIQRMNTKYNKIVIQFRIYVLTFDR